MRAVCVACASLLWSCASGFRQARKSNKTCVNFMIIGDFGSKKSAQKKVASSMAKYADEVKAEAILTVGDNIYSNGATSSSQMKKEWEDIYMQYDGNRRPWYAVMGNHDWRAYEKGGSDAQKGFKGDRGHWNMPTYWYSEKFDNAVEVFAIDTMIWRDDVPTKWKKKSEQKKWLETAMSSSSADWKIVIGHHPTFSGGRHGSSSAMLDELDPIMRKHKATIYFAGHDHSQQHMECNNVNYIISGAGCKGPRKKSNEYPTGSMKKFQGEEGFASLKICGSSEATLKFHKQDGKVGYEATLSNLEAGDACKIGGSSPRRRGDPSRRRDDGRRREERSRRSRRRRGDSSSAALAQEIGEGTVEQETDEVFSTKAVCKGVQLAKVDMRCSEDGCTVQPDTDSSQTSCDAYCSDQGLSCVSAWTNDFEDCSLDAKISCDDHVGDDAVQVCQCGALGA